MRRSRCIGSAGKIRIARRIGIEPERGANQHRGQNGQAIQPIGEVHRIARSDDHDVDENNEADQPQRESPVSPKRQVEVNIGRYVQRKTSVVPSANRFSKCSAWLNGKRQGKIKSCRQTNHGLPGELFTSAHTVWIVGHDLAVIIDPANGTVAQRNKKHHPNKAIPKICPAKR